MKIISLSNGHDASITAFEDGNILYHWELERVLNIKHFCGVDNNNEIADVLYNHCLPRLGWKPKDIDIIGFAGKSEWEKTEFAKYVPQYDNKNLEKPWEWGYVVLRGETNPTSCYSVVHHVNHLAYAYYTSPYNNALVYSLDGIGDGTMSMAGIGFNNKLEVKWDFVNKCPPSCTPNGIGLFYSYLGHIFPFLGTGPKNWLAAPGKAMGLSSYGKPRNEWRNIIREEMLRWMPDRTEMEKIPIKLGLAYSVENPMNKDCQDLMATIQDELELYILNTIDNLFIKEYNKEAKRERILCAAGGCLLNVQANTRLLDERVIDKLYTPPAVSDCGNSIGTALYIYHNILNNPRFKEHLHKPNLGDYCYNRPPSSLDSKGFADFDRLMAEKYPNLNYELIHMDITGKNSPIEKRMAQDIKDGLIVGVRHGRQEIGPRSLGWASLYADPSIASMKDKINLKVKHREVWRPYAGCCLQEDVENYFFCDKESPSLLYMLEAPQARPHTKDIMPAIIHTDNTCRIQVVTKQSNKHLFNLLTEFKKIGGCDAILLTSFNGPGQPIINNFYDALNLLRDTNLNVVYVEEWRFTKK